MGSRDFDVPLGPYVLRVKYVENIEDDGDKCDGLFVPDEKTILIDSALPPIAETETVLHEVIEAIDTLYDLGLSHQTITTLAMGLVQALGPRVRLGEL